MNKSIMNELESHIIDLIEEGCIDKDNLDDAHHVAFNQDYYIIGYYECDQWLKKHDVTPWEAIEYVVEKEVQHFGTNVHLMREGINSENTANNVVYFAGLELDIERIYKSVKEEY